MLGCRDPTFGQIREDIPHKKEFFLKQNNDNLEIVRELLNEGFEEIVAVCFGVHMSYLVALGGGAVGENGYDDSSETDAFNKLENGLTFEGLADLVGVLGSLGDVYGDRKGKTFLRSTRGTRGRGADM
ncbi:hypothetical protein HPP92_010892 [Vanilla planifolia]|uniref:Uncharacterized protein n=1 Tax=Vanilla planifolia TaxID=51239 RepID=A0A835RAI8_VANPL|nr:hypothetical protein HPP92_010892 [Vanilla planifolia]